MCVYINIHTYIYNYLYKSYMQEFFWKYHVCFISGHIGGCTSDKSADEPPLKTLAPWVRTPAE